MKMLTEEDGKCVSKWITECTSKSDELNKHTSIDRHITILDCISCYFHLLVASSLSSLDLSLLHAIHSQTHLPFS